MPSYWPYQAQWVPLHNDQPQGTLRHEGPGSPGSSDRKEGGENQNYNLARECVSDGKEVDDTSQKWLKVTTSPCNKQLLKTSSE